MISQRILSSSSAVTSQRDVQVCFNLDLIERATHHILANSVMAPYFFIYANRNKAEPREATKQVVWIILRNRIFHGTMLHIHSGFPLYARS